MVKLLLVLVVALAGLAAFVYTRPEVYHVERSARIEAPAETVFGLVSDFASMHDWSPWAKRDAAMRTTLSSPSAGVGATYAWEGNKEVGKGRMTITDSQPPTRLRERLEFIEPFASVAEAGFDVRPDGPTASTITWSMDGKNNFVGKAISVVMDMDKMVGKDFDQGLSNIKQLAEAKRPGAPAAPAAAATTAP
jgi:hypothetical protein